MIRGGWYMHGQIQQIVRSRWGNKYMRALISLSAMAVAMAVSLSAPAWGETAMKFSHHYPPTPGDWRYEIPVAFVQELAKANVGVSVTVYPDQTLMRAREQWDALIRGTVDFSIFSITEFAQGVPEVLALGLPAVIKDHEHARRLGRSPFMTDLQALVEQTGVMMLDGVWMTGAVGSSKECVTSPDGLAAAAVRTSSKALDPLVEAVGAISVPMASSELAKGLTTGAVDVVTLPAATFTVMPLEPHLKCLVLPGERILYFTYVPIFVSKANWAKLSPEQQGAVRAAAANAVEAGQAMILKLEEQTADKYAKAGVEVRRMGLDEFAAWRKLAEKTAWPAFDKISPRAPALLKTMRSVD